MEERKKNHIDLAFQSQTQKTTRDKRFNYEPMLSGHPEEIFKPFDFLGKVQKIPIWVSSMTGGTKLASKINANLARACQEFGMGMGLGSCRIILDNNDYFSDFDVREIIGHDYPLYANLGIAQIEQLIDSKHIDKAVSLVERLKADGLVIHVNPLQEWFQPEGDKLKRPAIEIIKEFIDHTDLRIIVKEVGQGMGPASLLELLKLPLEAIEFAAYGGTNFAKIELMRSDETRQQLFEPLSYVGHDAEEMTNMVNDIVESEPDVKTRQIIISGGIKSFLQGYYLIKRCRIPAVYGQASAFLKYAKENYESLRKFVEYQVKGLEMAFAFLRAKESDSDD